MARLHFNAPWLSCCVLAISSVLAAAPSPALATGSVVEDISSPCGGSSNPTFYSSQHRVVVTSGGRTLAIYDPHGSGQQLAWKDPGSTWQTATQGDVADGFFPGEEPNDHPASIATARDSLGLEHAWLVYSGYKFSRPSSVKLRRLSDLDDPAGPSVGPVVTVAATGLGNVRPDITFEQGGNGPRGILSWTRKSSSTAFEVVTASFTNVDSDTPSIGPRSTIHAGTSDKITATLAAGPNRTHLVTRTDRLRVFRHNAGDPASAWTLSSSGFSAPLAVKPSATVLDDGRTVVAFESNTSQHIVKLVAFSADSTSVTKLLQTEADHSQPALTNAGNSVVVAMVRPSNDRIVSIDYSNGTVGVEQLELDAQSGGNYAWPNLPARADNTLQMLVDGPRCPTNSQSNQVLYYERSLE